MLCGRGSIMELIDETVFKINKAIDFIDNNLHNQICLNGLSDISCFSKHDFIELFLTLTGQPPSLYIIRLRMNKAITLLGGTNSLPVSSISGLCGYSTESNFSKAFSDHFGISPYSFQNKLTKEYHRDCNLIAHNDFTNKKLIENVSENSLCRFHLDCRQLIKEEPYKDLLHAPNITTEHIPGITYIYSRHFGSLKSGDISSFTTKHFSYAHEIRKLFPETKMLGVFLDCPNLNTLDHCRYDAGITIPDDSVEIKNIGKRKISSGLYATVSLEIPLNLSRYVWYYFKTKWLLNTPYNVDHRPGFCEYTPIPNVQITEKMRIKFFLPIASAHNYLAYRV